MKHSLFQANRIESMKRGSDTNFSQHDVSVYKKCNILKSERWSFSEQHFEPTMVVLLWESNKSSQPGCICCLHKGLFNNKNTIRLFIQSASMLVKYYTIWSYWHICSAAPAGETSSNSSGQTQQIIAEIVRVFSAEGLKQAFIKIDTNIAKVSLNSFIKAELLN